VKFDESSMVTNCTKTFKDSDDTNQHSTEENNSPQLVSHELGQQPTLPPHLDSDHDDSIALDSRLEEPGNPDHGRTIGTSPPASLEMNSP
jgi:hypothetical protein